MCPTLQMSECVAWLGVVLGNSSQLPWLVSRRWVYHRVLTNQGSWLLLPGATPTMHVLRCAEMQGEDRQSVYPWTQQAPGFRCRARG